MHESAACSRNFCRHFLFRAGIAREKRHHNDRLNSTKFADFEDI